MACLYHRAVRRIEKPAALAGYVAVSIAYFGWRLLPHPGRVIFGNENATLYIWSFGWWRHAIGSWSNPLVTHALYGGTAVNLTWTPSAPGLALVFSPLTALFGPVVAYNVAGVLLPALAAWTAYLLCRYVTGSLWASLIGGYLFGFSAANLRQVSPGNINLSAVFLFPLVALVLLRYLRSELTARWLAIWLGVMLAFQLTISTESTVMVTLALLVSLPLAWWLVPDVRPRIRGSLGAIVAGYGLAAVIASPFVYYLLSDFNTNSVVTDIKRWGTDALAAFVPSFVIGFGGTDLGFIQDHVKSHSAYLGLPAVAMIVLYVVQSRRAPGGRFLLAAFAAAFVTTLGATLLVYGHTLVTLPWWVLASHVPGLNDALPFRFAILEALAGAVMVALWTARTKGRVYSRPFVLPLLAVTALAPAVWQSSAFTPLPLEHVSFFTSGLYKSCLPAHEKILVLPYAGKSLIWQSEANFGFTLVQGGLQVPGDRFGEDPVLNDLSNAHTYKPTMDRVLALAGAHGVDRVVSVATNGYPSSREMKRFGKAESLGGATVSPACGEPSLRTHDLARYVDTWERAQPLPRDIGWCLSGVFTNIKVGLEPLPSPANQVASYVKDQGLTCSPPPPGYTRHGFASAKLSVRGGTYPYYSP
jgi:hypothetical protein